MGNEHAAERGRAYNRFELAVLHPFAALICAHGDAERGAAARRKARGGAPRHPARHRRLAGPMRRGAQEADRASEAAADYTELARVLERRAAFELVD
jgi:hypothetical protein